MNRDNNPIFLVFLVLLVIGVYTMDILLLVDMLPKTVDTDKSVVQLVNLRVRDKIVRAELADTSDRRTTGLMFREFMEKDSGMFFVFSSAGLHSFWMKGTKLPLDILWLDDKYIFNNWSNNALAVSHRFSKWRKLQLLCEMQ